MTHEILSITAVLEPPRRDTMIWTWVSVTFLQRKWKSSTVLMKIMSALLLAKGSLTCWEISRYVLVLKCFYFCDVGLSGHLEVIFISMIDKNPGLVF